MPDQEKQKNWKEQWEEFYDDSLFLFTEWIHPQTVDFFRNKDVVDCGCGGGQHINFIAPYANSMLGIDLNTVEVARKNIRHKNVRFLEGDLATIKLDRTYDVTYCIGVLQHTVNPDRTFSNIKTFAKPGGRVIIWCYSKEGNYLNWTVLEPIKRAILLKLPMKIKMLVGWFLTLAMYFPIYTIYLLPLKFLPYFYYFKNWRLLSFKRNWLNVLDKINAPLTNFITKDQVYNWFNEKDFQDIYIDNYNGISWRASGTKI